MNTFRKNNYKSSKSDAGFEFKNFQLLDRSSPKKKTTGDNFRLYYEFRKIK